MKIIHKDIAALRDRKILLERMILSQKSKSVINE